MGLEEPVTGTGNNFVEVSGKGEICPLIDDLTILSTVFKYKDTSQWKNYSE